MSTSPAAGRSRSIPDCGAVASVRRRACRGRPTRSGSPTAAIWKARCTPSSSIRSSRTARDADHRRHEQCRQSLSFDPERQISVLHGVDRQRPVGRRNRSGYHRSTAPPVTAFTWWFWRREHRLAHIPPPESDDEKQKEGRGIENRGQGSPTRNHLLTSTRKRPGPRRIRKRRSAAAPKATVIDLPDIGNRILSLPIPSRNYVDLAVGGKTGELFLAEGPPVGRSSSNPGMPIRALWRFATDKRLTEEIPERAVEFQGLLQRREAAVRT